MRISGRCSRPKNRFDFEAGESTAAKLKSRLHVRVRADHALKHAAPQLERFRGASAALSAATQRGAISSVIALCYCALYAAQMP